MIHQTGVRNFTEVKNEADFVLAERPDLKERYRPFAFLNPLSLKMSAGTASLVITRAGSMLFEIAAWGVPAIVIPIPEEISRDQRSNAFAYARHGCGVVIEQANLSTPIIASEIHRILDDDTRRKNMEHAAQAFATHDAADKIATLLVDMALSHEK